MFQKGKSGNPKGRPKGIKNRLIAMSEQQRIDIARRAGITPLEFLLSAMRDPTHGVGPQLEAAKIAAPYLHQKMPIAIIDVGGSSQAAFTLTPEQLRRLSAQELRTLRDLLMRLGAETQLLAAA